MDFLYGQIVITFYSNHNRMEKLIEKFTEIEYNDSVQIMGDVLDLNSFVSEELNRLNFGISKDFGLYQCRLYMGNTVRIYCDDDDRQPIEFISKVCVKYNVKAKVETESGELIVRFNSQGNLTYESDAYFFSIL